MVQLRLDPMQIVREDKRKKKRLPHSHMLSLSLSLKQLLIDSLHKHLMRLDFFNTVVFKPPMHGGATAWILLKETLCRFRHPPLLSLLKLATTVWHHRTFPYRHSTVWNDISIYLLKRVLCMIPEETIQQAHMLQMSPNFTFKTQRRRHLRSHRATWLNSTHDLWN